MPGWLGGYPVAEWLQLAHGEEEPGCHITTNQSCAGLAIFRANIAKRVRDPDALRLPADKVNVFATDGQFRTHHEK